MATTVDSPTQEKVQLRSISWIFFKIGMTAFGGPATSIAMMEEEVVEKKKWIQKNYFLDMMGITNIIPGPNAVEMSLHIGYVLRGWLGLLIAGICFIFPAVAISLVLAIVYVLFSTLPEVQPILYGIKPIILAIILVAIFRLGKAAAKNWLLIVIGIIILPLAYFFDHYITVIFLGGGIVGMFALQIFEKIKSKKEEKEQDEQIIEKPTEQQKESKEKDENIDQENTSNEETVILSEDKTIELKTNQQIGEKILSWRKVVLYALLLVTIWGGLALILWLLSNHYPDNKSLKLGFLFYGIGSILYGSGYTLIAYMREGLVLKNGWLSEQQLFDGVAIGQFTPGPLTSTVTVIGYMVNGFAGAAIATLAFYIPSTLIVVFINPVVSRLRKSRWTASFLDAVNITSIAVMLVTNFYLGQGYFLDLNAWSIVVAVILLVSSLVILLKWKKVNSAILVLAGAVIGGLLKYFVLK